MGNFFCSIYFFFVFTIMVASPCPVWAGDPYCDGVDAAAIRSVAPFEDSGKQVVLIEDAHCQLPAQRAIMSILKTLLANYPANITPLVLQEGSIYGPIDTAVLRDDAGGSDFDAYLAAHLADGRIGAAEFLHARSGGFTFWGIEDRALYESNYEHFMFVSECAERVERFVAELDAMLTEISELVLSSDVAEVLQAMRAASQGDGVVEYILGELRDWALQYEVDLGAFDALSQMYDIADQLDHFDEVQLSREAEGLPHLDDTELTDDVLENFYTEGVITLERFPQLYRYARLKEALMGMPMEKVIHEKDALEKQLLRVAAISDAEREFVVVVHDNEIVRKLLTFQLTRDEYRAYVDSADYSELIGSVIGYLTSYYESYTPSVPLAELEAHSHGFYAVVRNRDDALARNIIQAMDEKGVDVAVAVIGGFHSEGIAQRLSRRDRAVTIVTPRVERVDQRGVQKYHDVMMSQRRVYRQRGVPAEATLSAPVQSHRTMRAIDCAVHVRCFKYTSLTERQKEVVQSLMYDEYCESVRDAGMPEALWVSRDEIVRNFVRGQDGETFVVLVKGTPVGFYHYTLSGDRKAAFGAGAFIAQNYRGFGVANRLRHELFLWLLDQGVREFHVSFVKDSFEAKGLHASLLRFGKVGDATANHVVVDLPEYRVRYRESLAVEMRYADALTAEQREAFHDLYWAGFVYTYSSYRIPIEHRASREKVLSLLAAHGYDKSLVCLVNGKPVAFQEYYFDAATGDPASNGVYTSALYRRLGLATRVRETLFTDLYKSGAERFHIHEVATSAEARGLHHALLEKSWANYYPESGTVVFLRKFHMLSQHRSRPVDRVVAPSDVNSFLLSA